MSVSVIDHVKREKVSLKSGTNVQADVIQLADDNFFCGRKMKDTEAVFTELVAEGVDGEDGTGTINTFVALQLEKDKFLAVNKPRDKNKSETLELRVIKTSYKKIIDEKNSKIPKKGRKFWFSLKAVGVSLVYESLAYKNFYISVEGETVLMRRCPDTLPHDRNFFINIVPALRRKYKLSRTRTLSVTEATNSGVSFLSSRDTVTTDMETLLVSGSGEDRGVDNSPTEALVLTTAMDVSTSRNSVVVEETETFEETETIEETETLEKTETIEETETFEVTETFMNTETLEKIETFEVISTTANGVEDTSVSLKLEECENMTGFNSSAPPEVTSGEDMKVTEEEGDVEEINGKRDSRSHEDTLREIPPRVQQVGRWNQFKSLFSCVSARNKR